MLKIMRSEFNADFERQVDMPRYPKGSPQYINKLNKIRILNLIRERGILSRADAAKLSGISAPTVTRIVDQLIHEEGLIREVGAGKSSGGRRPKMLEFSSLENFVIGIDLGTTHIDGVLANLNAETIAEVKIPTDVNQGFERIMHRTAEVIKELRQNPAVRGKKIFGVALAVAGLINREKKIVEFSPDFHWENADIIKTLRKKCDLPIIYDNVTRVTAIGELLFGIGKELKDFVVVNVGYGIGAGIIINGTPLYGPKGMAGEFGHITLDKNSNLRCECGNYGCLEALSSGRAIALRARSVLNQNSTASMLLDMCQGDLTAITAAMVADAASKGDELATRIFSEAAEYLGIGIAGLVNLLSPQAIVIGGGVAEAGDLLFDVVKKTVAARAMKNISAALIIRPSTFGLRATVKGAIALILSEVLHLNFNINTYQLTT